MNLFEPVSPDPQTDATRLLTVLHSPITDPYPLPVVPELLAEQIGLITIDYDLPQLCLGYLHWDDLGPHIVINRNQPACRRRLVQAQELGRFVDIMQQGKREEYQQGTYRNDSYVTCFAQELLMPKHAIAQLPPDVPLLVEAFGVDQATMRRRLSDLAS
jgi:hypothetical protein